MTFGNSIINYFQRLKYHILLSSVIFISFTVLGYLYPSIFSHLIQPIIANMQNGVHNGTIELKTVPLFVNNFSVALNMILGGVTLSINTVYLMIYNALLVGYTGTFVDLGYYLSLTLPHGIFELTAIILAGASSFRITQAILVFFRGLFSYNSQQNQLKEYTKVSIDMCLDAIILIGLIVVLLVIAAYIEANLTIPFTQTIYNIK